MVLVDTSVWVRCLEPENPIGQVCSRAIAKETHKGTVICTCAQVIIELWAVASRPKTANGLGMSCEQVDQMIDGLLDVCLLLDEPPDIAARWRALARKYGPVGKPCHDLRLVAVALSHGVKTVLTRNSADFARYSEIEVIDPSRA